MMTGISVTTLLLTLSIFCSGAWARAQRRSMYILLLSFLPARRLIAVIACPYSVRISVRRSQAGIVSQRLNVASQKQRRGL